MNDYRREMVKKVLNMIKEDYVFQKSTFELQNAFFCDLDSDSYKRVDDLFKATRQDFSKILTIMNCIESTYSMYKEDSFKSTYYEIGEPALEEIACHIEYMFTKYRVILEYMEEILEICIPPILPDYKQKEYNEISLRKGSKAKAERFDYLLQYICMSDNENKWILNTKWFQDFRRDRNSLIHRGASCLVYGDKKELLFNVMKIDEMEREDEVCIDDYFLTDKALIKYNRFWGIMLSELIVFCEAIFAFLLTEATISDVNKCVLDIVQCSKRIFTVGDESDKQTILEKILLGLLEKN